jgi:hypothetical protein
MGVGERIGGGRRLGTIDRRERRGVRKLGVGIQHRHGACARAITSGHITASRQTTLREVERGPSRPTCPANRLAARQRTSPREAGHRGYGAAKAKVGVSCQ